MKLASSAAVVAAPSIGPAVITFLGQDIPVLALLLSACALVLARVIAPPPLRKLTRMQSAALTLLLFIVLALVVTGQITGSPLEPGMAVVWGAGLGFSGLAVVEIFAERVQAALRSIFGKDNT